MKGYSISASLWNSGSTFLQRNSQKIHVFNFGTKLNQRQWKSPWGAEAVCTWHQLGRLLSAAAPCSSCRPTLLPLLHIFCRHQNTHTLMQHHTRNLLHLKPPPPCPTQCRGTSSILFQCSSLSLWIFVTGTILFLVQKSFHYISTPLFLLCWCKITSVVALALASNCEVLPH